MKFETVNLLVVTFWGISIFKYYTVQRKNASNPNKYIILLSAINFFLDSIKLQDWKRHMFPQIPLLCLRSNGQ